MKINKIFLKNIGPYIGENNFFVNDNKEGNIILVGGKNGAGKTTLFSAIKLCFYGYKEYGYQTANSHYKASVKKLINDDVKIDGKPIAEVEVDFDINNEHDWINYRIKRCWDLNKKEFENVYIFKNNIKLDENEMDDFESYLMGIIPPALFHLFFFDGEEIADFLLSENSDNIRSAFLTLCGFDTFEIIYQNLVKVGKENKGGNETLETYLKIEDDYSIKDKEFNQFVLTLKEIEIEIDNKQIELEKIEKKFKRKGGITHKDLDEKYKNITIEEKEREILNNKIKEIANNKLPFFILRENLENLEKQIYKEEQQNRLRVLCEEFIEYLPKAAKRLGDINNQKFMDKLSIELDAVIRDEIDDSVKEILKFSEEERRINLVFIKKMMEFDVEEIKNIRRELKASKRKGKKYKKEIDACNIDEIQSYIEIKEKFFNEIIALQTRYTSLLSGREQKETELEVLKNKYILAEKKLDLELKTDSINSITAKSVKYFARMRKLLYDKEIKQVEKNFMFKMEQLVRKKIFIDAVTIDEKFTIHVYKKITVEIDKVCNQIKTLGEEFFCKDYGVLVLSELFNKFKVETLSELIEKHTGDTGEIVITKEFNKDIMSQGERQVFIMALYWALIQLSKQKVPFIIDTPFARIDTEHRNNITKHFFNELSGQIFIFSTDEEIVDEYFEFMKPNINKVYMIENTENATTTIIPNKYFGEII